ncbi:ABC transporter substrate-binding protein [Micromonospora sp. NPDC050417]|uniref:ABC transporter substrate-binding protein n=1 Tax=Micromonospora sp. NPDC050417 TaxID=3364280 RepID=UPI0037AFF3A7
MRGLTTRPFGRTLGVLCAATLALAGAACGAGDPADKDDNAPVTLQFVWWGNDDRAEKTRAAVELFESKHPNITVETSFGAYDAYFQKLSTQIAGGDTPDVVQMDRAYFREYAERNALLDLTPFLGRTLHNEDVAKALKPAGEFGDAVYGIPAGLTTQGLAYDPQVWEKAGVAAPTTTWTWDDFLAAATKLSQSSGGKVAGTTDFGWAIDWFDAWLQQRGKTLYTEDAKLGFTVGELTEFWNLTAQFRAAGAATPAAVTTQVDGAMPTSAFVKKQSYSEINYDSSFTAYRSSYGESVAYGPLPSNTDKRGMVAHASMSFSVSRGTEHPDQATMLVDFLINDVEAGKLLGVARGLPTNTKVLAAVAPALAPGDKAVYDYQQSVAALLLPTPPAQPKGGGAIKQEFQRIYDEIIFGRLPIGDGAKRLVDEANDALG